MSSAAIPERPVLPKRAAHYLWAVLIARIYEVSPLVSAVWRADAHHRVHYAQR
jgi:hypothetical protein